MTITSKIKMTQKMEDDLNHKNEDKPKMEITPKLKTTSKKKCHKLWKKSTRGEGQRQNQNSLHFKCRLTNFDLMGGGPEFFTFFPNSINRNITLIFMTGTVIGEIFATFGSYIYDLYMNKIVPMY